MKGIKLTAVIAGSIITVGTAALFTPLAYFFARLGLERLARVRAARASGSGARA